MGMLIWEEIPQPPKPKTWYFRLLLCEKADLFDPKCFPFPDPWLVVTSGHLDDAPKGWRENADKWLAENASDHVQVNDSGEFLFQSQTDALMFYLRFKS